MRKTKGKSGVWCQQKITSWKKLVFFWRWKLVGLGFFYTLQKVDGVLKPLFIYFFTGSIFFWSWGALNRNSTVKTPRHWPYQPNTQPPLTTSANTSTWLAETMSTITKISTPSAPPSTNSPPRALDHHGRPRSPGQRQETTRGQGKPNTIEHLPNDNQQPLPPTLLQNQPKDKSPSKNKKAEKEQQLYARQGTCLTCYKQTAKYIGWEEDKSRSQGQRTEARGLNRSTTRSKSYW